MSVQAIDRAFDILEFLSKEPGGVAVTEISRRLDLHKSTVHRLLSSLKDRGYVEKDSVTSHYKLGLGFVELASLYLNGLELKTEASPYLHQLAQSSGQTTFLAIRDGMHVVYMDKAETFDSLRRYTIIGKRTLVYASSLGKAMLSGLRDEDIERLFPTPDQQLDTLTKKTITSFDTLMNVVRVARERGWATDDEENEMGTRCVGAPIFDYRDRVIAAVSVAWDCKANPGFTFEDYADQVVRSAASISLRMGCTKSKIRRLAK